MHGGYTTMDDFGIHPTVQYKYHYGRFECKLFTLQRATWSSGPRAQLGADQNVHRFSFTHTTIFVICKSH